MYISTILYVGIEIVQLTQWFIVRVIIHCLSVVILSPMLHACLLTLFLTGLQIVILYIESLLELICF